MLMPEATLNKEVSRASLQRYRDVHGVAPNQLFRWRKLEFSLFEDAHDNLHGWLLWDGASLFSLRLRQHCAATVAPSGSVPPEG
jgi:hypothetical protein